MPDKRSIIFCGTPEFAVPSLEALLSDDAFEVTLVVTREDKPQGRKQVLTPPPVKDVALAAGAPVFQPRRFNAELPGYMEAHGIARPDFLVVVAYGAILSRASLEIPRIAPINVHGSLLPRWRGASPVEQAILAGDAETGVTVQIMAEALDAGDILSFAGISLDARETAVRLRESLSRLGAELLCDTLKKPLKPFPQPAHGVTFCTKLTKDDGKADPRHMTAEEIDRRVRALNPWPGVTVEIDGQPLKLLETELVASSRDAAPLPCAHGSTLQLLSVQPAGKKPMTGAAWANGRKI